MLNGLGWLASTWKPLFVATLPLRNLIINATTAILHFQVKDNESDMRFYKRTLHILVCTYMSTITTIAIRPTRTPATIKTSGSLVLVPTAPTSVAVEFVAAV